MAKFERNDEVQLPDGTTGVVISGRILKSGKIGVQLHGFAPRKDVDPDTLTPYSAYLALCDVIMTRR